jgi:hypothetical protein
MRSYVRHFDGDEVLRQEVESLLCYELDSMQFLERPVAGVAADAAGETSMIDRLIGSYTIVAPPGAGGMGEVYRANARDAQSPSSRRDLRAGRIRRHHRTGP